MPAIRRKTRIVPVLDIKEGCVIRAVKGLRADYRPLKSALVSSSEPQVVAEALLKVSGSEELYLADLDAILGGAINGLVLNRILESCPFPVWLDGGFGSGFNDCEWFGRHRVHPVIGFETCGGRDYLRGRLAGESEGKASTHPGRVPATIGFSIDLREGVLIGDWRAWGLRNERDTLGLAREVIGMGCKRLIVLDLARVGTGSGCGTEELLQAIRTEFQEIELIAGGGVKAWEDVDSLGFSGVDAVLVASALHDRTITFPRPA